MVPPSGDQPGSESRPGSVVRRVRPEPSTLMVQTSLLPLSNAQVKASTDPSGAQAIVAVPALKGRPVDARLPASLATPDPSAFIRYSSRGPPRSLAKAIRWPSGDHAAALSVAG